ncbi:MAG: protein kinase [Phycisphaerales bacterium]
MSTPTDHLTEDQRRLVREILAAAMDVPPAEHDGLVERMAAGDSDVAAEALALLRYADELDDVVRERGDPFDAVMDLARDRHASRFAPGARIGRYTIECELGRGGFGIVYLAAQRRPFQRRVALKVLSLGIESEAAADRFRHERQVLASLGHRSIAAIYDAGTTECGRLYFAMEYVDGKSLTTYCDEARLSIRERLALFSLVCDAVHHAHQRGVIHRDLKPSNILVVDEDGRPIPKIIDFGVAKAIDPGASKDVTLPSVPIGTPAYMSPEQFRAEPTGVDVRSDVFSLGVILYELLSGVLPRDDDPRTSSVSPPSRRLSAATGVEQLALARRTDPDSLRGALQGELWWVLNAALRPEQSERYASVAALGDDLRALLGAHPVSVGPDSTGYRVRKFVARHRLPVVAASVAVVALVLGVVGTSVAAVVAMRNADAARKARDQAEWRAYAARVNLLGSALNAHNTSLTRSLRPVLDEHPGSWEERYVKARLGSYLWSVVPDGQRISAVAATDVPGRSTIVVSTDPGVIHLIDPETGEVTRSRALHENDGNAYLAVQALALSPDARLLLSGDDSGRVVISDAETLEPIVTYELGISIRRAAYSPMLGAFVVLNINGRLLGVRADGASPREVAAVDHDVADLALDETGRYAALAGPSPTGSSIVDLQTGVVTPIDQRNCGRVAGIRNPPAWLASFHDREADRLRLSLLDLRTGDLLREYPVAFNPAGEICVNADGTRAAFVPTYSPAVYALDPDSGKIHLVGAHDDGWVFFAAFLDDHHLVTGSTDGSVRLWDVRRGQGIQTITRSGAFLVDVTSSPDGRRLAVCADRGDITIHDLASGEVLQRWTLAPSDGALRDLVFSPDGRRAAVTFSQGQVQLRDADSGEVIERLSGPVLRRATAVKLRGSFSPDGRYYAAPDPDAGSVRLWDATSLEPAGTIPVRGLRPFDAEFSPDSRTIAVACRAPEGSAGGAVVLFDAETGRLLAHYEEFVGGITNVRFHPSSEILAVAGDEGEACMIDLATGARRALLGIGSDSVTSLAFTPDGSRLLATGLIKQIVVWDTATGVKLLAIPGPSDGYLTNDIDIARDGSLVSCGGNRVQIHPVAPP